jgi:Phosphodiester glycosidase/SPOR domain
MRARIVWLVLLVSLGASAPATARELPLGPGWLPETSTGSSLAPGVTYTRIERGFATPRDVYTVDVALTATRVESRALRRRLGDAGHPARIERVRRRALDDPRPGPLGYLVRVGAFAGEPEADAFAEALVAAGFPDARAVFTGEDGRRTTGPWVVYVLEIDPAEYGGAIAPALATDVIPGREPLSALAGRSGALAALNGGYFVIGDADGTDGDLAGVSVLGGALVSEAVNGRTSLVLPDRTGAAAFIDTLRTRQTVVAPNGARRELDGLNRKPGLIRSCGGSGGDEPTERPKHDFTCTDASELIRFDRVFGAETPAGPGAEAVLDAGGVVTELRAPRGGPIPPGGAVLAGTASAADWLYAHAQPGSRVSTRLGVAGERGPLALGPRSGVVNGGPRLLRNGRRDIPAYAEGFVWPEDPAFFYRFGVRRNPRTLAGLTADGRLLLVAIDGRRPGFSVGASFVESARVLRALGAADGVNLDGGGSTSLTLGSTLVNRPSDDTGERPIGDALLLLGSP